MQSLADNSVEFRNHIPDAVRRQSKRADEIAREIGVENVEDEIVDEPIGGAESPVPVVEPAAPVEPAPIAEPAAPEPVDWEQRFRTLQGKYESELPQMRGQITSLERVIAAMNSAVPEPAEPRHTTTVPVEILREDVEAYGQDLIDAVTRWIMPRVDARLSMVDQRLEQMAGSTHQLEQRTSKQIVFDALDVDPSIGKRWRDINLDPGFLGWLNEMDPYSGRPRNELIQDAFTRGDAVRCGAFFKTYIAEHTATHAGPTPVVEPVQTAPAGQADRPSLESLAAPGRATGTTASSGAPDERRVYTNREIAAFYRNVNKGVYAGKEAVKQRLEADIILAASEGRVRP